MAKGTAPRALRAPITRLHPIKIAAGSGRSPPFRPAPAKRHPRPQVQTLQAARVRPVPLRVLAPLRARHRTLHRHRPRLHRKAPAPRLPRVLPRPRAARPPLQAQAVPLRVPRNRQAHLPSQAVPPSLLPHRSLRVVRPPLRVRLRRVLLPRPAACSPLLRVRPQPTFRPISPN